MTVRREYRNAPRTPERSAELGAIRDRYQAEKPSLEDVVAEGGVAEPLGEVLRLHELLAGLRAERLRQRLTLAEMEARTGISQAALSRLETGKAENPTVGTVGRVAAALGKVVTYELRDATPAPGPV